MIPTPFWANDLDDCKARCRSHRNEENGNNKDCTAINFKGFLSSGSCELRACPLPVKPPTFYRYVHPGMTGWYGYYLNGGKLEILLL